MLVVTALTPEKKRRWRPASVPPASRRRNSFPSLAARPWPIRFRFLERRVRSTSLWSAAEWGLPTFSCTCAELNTLCIDAGYCLDLLADPSLAGKREFTQPDQELRRSA